MSAPVLYERRGDVGVVRLNRPEVRNAVNDDLLQGLETIVEGLEQGDAPRVVILTGSGSRSFCAGADLSWVGSLAEPEQGLELSRRIRELLARLADGPRPLIAAVNGDALGGGAEILTACHLRLAAEHARLGFRQAAMGVVTGWGGGARLLRLLGRSRALRLLLTAETLDAPEALRLGLVDRVVPAGRLMAEAFATAERIAANCADSVRAFLELARAGEHQSPPEVEGLEVELFERLWNGDHFRRKVAEWQRRSEDRQRREGR